MLFALELRLPRQSAIAMRFRTTPAGLVATGVHDAADIGRGGHDPAKALSLSLDIYLT